jgi:isoamylase
MLLGGDEFGRSQGGNNNGYAQDSEISWFDWSGPDEDLLAWTRDLLGCGGSTPCSAGGGSSRARPVRGERFHDIAWMTPDGQLMSDEHWSSGFAKSLGVFLNGAGLASRDERGGLVLDDSFLLLINAHHEPLTFQAPVEGPTDPFVVVFDTTERRFRDPEHREVLTLEDRREVAGRSMVLLREEPEEATA